MKTLMLDIETAPHVAHCWGLWDQNVGLSQLVSRGYILCWAAKWVGKEKVYFDSRQNKTAAEMLKGIHALLSEADAVISWNGQKFDIPWLNGEFVLNGFLPPAPYQQIDLLLAARRKFKFASNKLEFVAKALGCTQKIKVSEGHELWVQCMAGNRQAWATMKAYNINDTCILEEIYAKILPWIQGHPHVGVHNDKPDACSNCGSDHLVARGWAYTKLTKYRRYLCQACGTWTRSGKRILGARTQGVTS